jgi:hypothetical protein
MLFQIASVRLELFVSFSHDEIRGSAPTGVT